MKHTLKVVLASQNPGKLRELKALSSKCTWLELQLITGTFEPEETGSTFAENALIKARLAAHLSGMLALADDSGIVVDALNGLPGIHSARYCEGDDEDRRVKLLQDMSDVPASKRQAEFVCAMAMCKPDGSVLYQTEGRFPGLIAFQQRGRYGFGYDPIFYLPEYNKTSAQLTASEKNKISHRAQAWNKMFALLKQGHDNCLALPDTCHS